MKRIAVASIVIASIAAGCGSSGSDSGSTAATTTAAVPAATAARQAREAEGVCRRLALEAARLGGKAGAVELSRYASTLEFTTEALIAPAQPAVERAARELRAIRGSQAESKLSAYVNLFDPLLSLIEDRLRAGRAGDSEEAHEIELEIVELGQIQRTLAKEAQLKSCQVELIGAFGSQTAG